MTRVWLILADIPVTLLLSLSLRLFYLYPLKKEKPDILTLPMYGREYHISSNAT